MKRIFCVFLAAMLISSLAGCGEAGQDAKSSNAVNTPDVPQQQETISPSSIAPEDIDAQTEDTTAVVLTVGNQTFSATLLDNETAREFAAMLPMTLDMSELNGNEKYFYIFGEKQLKFQAI